MSNLKNVRMNTGISQTQLAKASGVSFRMIQYYEQGVKNIDSAKLETLASLARALNCGLSEILDHPEILKDIHV